MKTPSACRHLPHKGEKANSLLFLQIFMQSVPQVKPLSLVGGASTPETPSSDPGGGLQPVVDSAPSAGKVSSTTVPFPGAERMRASPPLWRTKP